MNVTRRSFLKSSAVASLWTAGGCAGFPAITSVRSPNALLSHACIGTANMAGHDLRQFIRNPNVRIAALCDVDANLLAAARKLVPDARVYADYREMLEKEGDRIDSVNVSTPDHVHTVQIAAALKAGKHVYAQKPLCKYFDEAAYLRALSARTGLVTQLGTQMAASERDRQLVAILRSGMFGPVERIIMFSTRSGCSRTERTVPVAKPVPSYLNWDLWIGPAPMRDYSPDYHPKIWRKFTDFGSGWIGDLCVHMISAPWQGLEMGERAPLSVRAEVNASALTNPAYRGCWPRYSHIVWKMPGVPASGGKPFEMEWLSGLSDEKDTPANFLPPPICAEVAAKGKKSTKLEYEGRLVETASAYLLVPHGWGDYETVVVMKDGSTPPPLPEMPAAPSHYDEFVDRCLCGGLARSDFSWSARMMDAVLMGGIAERLPNVEHRWNAATRTFDTVAANALAKSNYRDGWA